MIINQKKLVYDYMKQNGSITPQQAFINLGVTKLATVISELRLKEGVAINKNWCESVNRYGRKSRFMKYSLKKEGNKHVY